MTIPTTLGQIDNTVDAARLQCVVETGPALLRDLTAEGLADLELRARTQPFRRQFTRAKAHAMADVRAGKDEIMSCLVAPAQHHMRMRIVGIPVIDRHPVQ